MARRREREIFRQCQAMIFGDRGRQHHRHPMRTRIHAGHEIAVDIAVMEQLEIAQVAFQVAPSEDIVHMSIGIAPLSV